MSRRRVARSARATNPPAPSSQPKQQPQTEYQSRQIVIRVDEINRQYTPEQWKREIELVDQIQALHIDPSGAHGDPQDTKDAVERLLKLHSMQ